MAKKGKGKGAQEKKREQPKKQMVSKLSLPASKPSLFLTEEIKVPDATPEGRKVVLSVSAEDLAADSPPEPFLHNLIAAKTGVTPQTVPKTLLQYRLDRLGKAVISRPN